MKEDAIMQARMKNPAIGVNVWNRLNVATRQVAGTAWS
jgi:hypothetical protein